MDLKPQSFAPVDPRRDKQMRPAPGTNTAVFLWNIVLAAVWVLATGGFAIENLLLGLVFGLAIVWLLQPILKSGSYCALVGKIVALNLFFLRELLLSNLRVARDVLTPARALHPAVIAVPLEAESEFEIVLLSVLLTLTPGTLTFDVSEDRSMLYVHTMQGADPNAEKQRIKNSIERRILEITR